MRLNQLLTVVFQYQTTQLAGKISTGIKANAVAHEFNFIADGMPMHNNFFVWPGMLDVLIADPQLVNRLLMLERQMSLDPGVNEVVAAGTVCVTGFFQESNMAVWHARLQIIAQGLQIFFTGGKFFIADTITHQRLQATKIKPAASYFRIVEKIEHGLFVVTAQVDDIKTGHRFAEQAFDHPVGMFATVDIITEIDKLFVAAIILCV